MLACGRNEEFKPLRQVAAQLGMSVKEKEAPEAQVVHILEDGEGFQLEFRQGCRLPLRPRSSGGLETVPHAACGNPMSGFRMVEATVVREGDALTADARGFLFFFGGGCQLQWSSRWVRTAGGARTAGDAP